MGSLRKGLLERVGDVVLHPRLGFVLLVACWAPLILVRARMESNLWIDEIYSLALVSHTPADVVRLTAADAHPPGYYLALKGWLKMLRLLGNEPGVFWARSLNVGGWLALALAAWVGGRRVAGRRGGTLVAWMVAGGAFAALHARDLRSYGFAALGVFVVTLVILNELGFSEGRGGLGPAVTWGLAVIAATVALWSHLLAAVALGVLAAVTLTVLATARTGGETRKRFLIGGAAAGAVTLLGFLPWLLRVDQQLAYLDRSAPTWMTPPTIGNLWNVFTFWLPYGRIGDPGSPENPVMLSMLSVGAVAIPLLLGLVAFLNRSHGTSRTNGIGWAAAVTLGTSILFVVILWCLDRWDIAYTFHGPRYPSLVAPLWSAGLALLAGWALRRLDRSEALATLAVLPLLVCSMTGQWLLARREASWGLMHWKESALALFPEPGEPVYVMPSELAPFFRRSLAEYDVRRIEELPCGALEARAVTIVDVNPWRSLDRTRDRLVRQLLTRTHPAETIERRRLPEGRDDVRVTRLVHPDRGRFATLCQTGLVSRLAGLTELAASRALPEDQEGRGWSFLEIGDDLTTGRWATSEDARLTFDRPLPAGSYLLHLVGERQPYPRETLDLRVDLEGTDVQLDAPVGAGAFDLSRPITVEVTIVHPVLDVRHPTWSPSEVGLSGDDRTLSFLLRAAWFESR